MCEYVTQVHVMIWVGFVYNSCMSLMWKYLIYELVLYVLYNFKVKIVKTIDSLFFVYLGFICYI